jgi:hypothetical protein
MLHDRKNNIYFKYIPAVLLLSLLSFSCAKKPPSEKIALRISSYSLTAGEFNDLFDDLNVKDTPRAREAFLDNLITRKLLVKEAQRQGLDRKKDFLRSIENFWEQSLVKIVIDKKTSQIAKDEGISTIETEGDYNLWVEKLKDETRIEVDKKSIGIE